MIIPIRNHGGCKLCGEKVLARGWCSMHYKRWTRTGDPGPAERINQQGPGDGLCSVPGCPEKHNAKGYCDTHHKRFLRTGDASPDKAFRKYERV